MSRCVPNVFAGSTRDLGYSSVLYSRPESRWTESNKVTSFHTIWSKCTFDANWQIAPTLPDSDKFSWKSSNLKFILENQSILTLAVKLGELYMMSKFVMEPNKERNARPSRRCRRYPPASPPWPQPATASSLSQAHSPTNKHQKCRRVHCNKHWILIRKLTALARAYAK